MLRGPMFGGGTMPLLSTVVQDMPPSVLFSIVYVVNRFCWPRRMLKKVEGSWFVLVNVKR